MAKLDFVYFLPHMTHSFTRSLALPAIAAMALCGFASLFTATSSVSAQIINSSSSTTSSQSSTPVPPPPVPTCDEAKAANYTDYGWNGAIVQNSQDGGMEYVYAYLKWQGPQVFFWVKRQSRYTSFSPFDYSIMSTVTRDYTYNKDPRAVDLSKERLLAKAHVTDEEFFRNKITTFDEYYYVTSFGENPYDKNADKYPGYWGICDTRPPRGS